MKIDVKWEGLDAYLRALTEAPAEADRALGRALRKSGNRARSSIRKAAPRVTGRVRSSGVRQRVKGRGADTVVEVYLAGGAIPLHRGQRPHTIEPRTASVLKLPNGFATRVEHPGASPNQFFETGIDNAMEDIDRELDVAGAEVARIIDGR